MKLSKYSTRTLIFSSAFVVSGLVACSGSDDDPLGDAEECSGHGELHGDHCDCDEGYEPDHDDGLSCVDAHGDEECGGHGHLHDDHCDCDEGYSPDPDDELVCEKEHGEEECGGHGHLHDDHCDCDDGYLVDEDDDTLCVEKDDETGGMGGSGGMGGDSTELRAARLAVSDAEQGKVTVLSLQDGDVVDTFDLDAPASIYGTESGRFAVLSQAAENKFGFLDSGLILEEHGDHVDRLQKKPRLLDFELRGADYGTENPVHFVSHSGYLTFHFDGTWDEDEEDHVLSQNVILAEDELTKGSPELTLVLESLPQHGVSVVTESGHLLMTEPSSDRDIDTLPNGISVRSLDDGEVLQLFHDGDDFDASCWGLHGEALSHGDALFGCHQENDGGALLISWDDEEEEFVSRKLEYPGYPDAPHRTSVLIGHPKSDYFVGQWGTYSYPDNFYDGLVRISPRQSEVLEEDTLELGEVYCSFGFELSAGEVVAALTRDGKLHVVDVQDWQELGVVDVVEDLSEEQGCAGLLTMGDGSAYVSESSSGTVYEVDLEDLSVSRTFDVGGAPYGMAVLGYFGLPGKPSH